MEYEYLEHTADVKFRAYGKDLEEAFINAAYAYQDTVSDHIKIEKNVEKEFFVESEDKKALLYDFIEQFIVFLDTEDFLLAEVLELKIEKKGGQYYLFAKITGDTDVSKYEIGTHVKAMTYQEMKIEKKEKVMVQAVLDI